ncbi:IucA/IucC family protein [Halobacillus sp. H74]|uniref:IucA/IucC family protein n=1 Tax=Halobacillus sp. H74 TaxID=3457436 RepID=UPI003FCC70A4
MTISAMKSQSLIDTELLKEEESCLSFAKEYLPAQVPRFLHHREMGRKGILYKLADSVLRENIDGFYERAVDLKKHGGSLYINGRSFSWEKVYEPLKKLQLRKDLTYKYLKLEGYALLFPIKNEYAFQLVETTDEVIYVDSEKARVVPTASTLTRLLFSKENYPNVDTFTKELNNGTVNLMLASMYQEEWKGNLQEEAEKLEVRTTMEYLQKKRTGDARFSSSLFFEQLTVEGHHLHPGAKTKLGVTFPDVFRYSPEFHQSFNVRFAAVRKTHIISTEEKGLVENHYPEKCFEVRKELERRGYAVDTFDILPVHPWQFAHAIPAIYEQEIEAGTVVLLQDVKLPAEATSSFRTVAPKQEGAPDLKLAVNSQMTSTVRSISMQTAMNSTVVTDLLKDIMDKEPRLQLFLPLNELGGAAFQSEDDMKSRNLTVLLRENIDEYLEDDEIAIAGMALYATSPFSETTVLKELVDTFAHENNLKRDVAAHDFFQEYIEKVLPGYLTLMVKYGVALEGHLQNSIPVFKNGRISRFFFRDWGGARIYTERLRNQGFSPGFAPDSVSVTNQDADMHNKLYYTVFQNHLGEMIRQLVQYSGRDEAAFWTQVKTVCDGVLHELSLQQDIAEQVRLDRTFLYQSTVMHKSLTKMRLTDSKGYGYNAVPNPLAD